MAPWKRFVVIGIFLVFLVAEISVGKTLSSDDGYFFTQYYQTYHSNVLVRMVNSDPHCPKANFSPGAEECSDAYDRAENIVFVAWLTSLILLLLMISRQGRKWLKHH